MKDSKFITKLIKAEQAVKQEYFDYNFCRAIFSQLTRHRWCSTAHTIFDGYNPYEKSTSWDDLNALNIYTLAVMSENVTRRPDYCPEGRHPETVSPVLFQYTDNRWYLVSYAEIRRTCSTCDVDGWSYIRTHSGSSAIDVIVKSKLYDIPTDTKWKPRDNLLKKIHELYLDYHPDYSEYYS
jgi:hypothetical protein